MSVTQLRTYQLAVADRARRSGNHVVVLPTGAGKTHVSFELIFVALVQQPRKVVCFLAPTVALVQQQRNEFEKEASGRGVRVFAGLLAGGKRHDVGRCHIVFATPQAAFNEFGSYSKMNDLSLIVLDEVHHVEAKKGKSCHPYSLIVDVYAAAPNKRARPKLLGLTASPSESSEQTRRMLRRLEASLVIVKDPQLVRDLKKVVPRAELVADSLTCGNTFKAFLNKCVNMQQSLQRDFSEIREGDIALEQQFKARLRAVVELAARVRCLGWGCHDLFDGLRRLDVDHALQGVWEELLSASATECSPCFIRLLSILQQKRPERCIVFVETRGAARDMTKALRNAAARSEWDLGWLCPTHLVGRCKRGDDESMSMADQERILALFRRGETNVMVATSVAEEGIDIAACNLVVRMEPVHTVIKFVQGRGRARFSNSCYLIMCTDPLEVALIRNIEQRERELDIDLLSMSECRVAENCWKVNTSDLPDPLLMSQLPPQSARREFVVGDEQVVFGKIVVPLAQLAPTQSTVEKIFSDGRSVLQVMAQLVRNPVDIRALPLMKVSHGDRVLLGRRSESFQQLCRDHQLWFSADNRRCFMYKVIAPLIPDMISVKALHVNWTHEFDCKLKQCPRLGDTWTTDDAGVEAARDELLRTLIEPVPVALARPRKRSHEGSCVEFFRDGVDYISKLNLHLQRLQRPQSGAELTEYREVGMSFTMEVRVFGTTEWHRGQRHSQKKTAKQSAAFEALQALDVI